MSEPQTEQEWAAYYQARRHDASFRDEWGEMEPVRRPRGRPSRGLRATIAVRFSEEEAAIIRQEAKATSSTYSDVIRRLVREHASSTTPMVVAAADAIESKGM